MRAIGTSMVSVPLVLLVYFQLLGSPQSQLVLNEDGEWVPYEERAEEIKEDIKNRISEIPIDEVLCADLADKLSNALVVNFAEKLTAYHELTEAYANTGAFAEQYNPRVVLQEMVDDLRALLLRRLEATRELEQNARIAYQNYLVDPQVIDCQDRLNDFDPTKDDQQCLFQYATARFNDNAVRFADMTPVVNSTIGNFEIVKETDINLNFNSQPINTNTSVVIVPVQIYNRDLAVLRRIKWTHTFFDRVVKQNIKKFGDDIGFQFLCSSDGAFRFHPAISWKEAFDRSTTNVDLFDCRLTPWYVDTVTGPKQMVILLDTSGSMYGQRYEIAKQMIELIMETLTESDYFNILTFNHDVKWAAECLTKLMQATTRNKKLLRAAIDTQELEEVADYPRALEQALETLLQVNCSDPANASIANQTCYLEELYASIYDGQWVNTSDTSNCNRMIMLVSDGAPETYEEIFKLRNPDKKVRMFSFLIGEAVTEFAEMRSMSCQNRGFFVHIPNLSSAQTKVMNYVSVLSRPLALTVRDYLAEDKPLQPTWTGARLSRLLTSPKRKRYWHYDPVMGVWNQTMKTIAAQPLQWKNVTVLGVVGTDIPLQHLISIAGTFRLGANGYTFMTDANGYVMYHPQLRPNTIKGELKPNYNGVDILEVEVQNGENLKVDFKNYTCAKPLEYNATLRMDLVQGKTGELELDIMVASEFGYFFSPKRVFPQRVNLYYSGLGEEYPYSVGIGIPQGVNGDWRVNMSAVDVTKGPKGQPISNCLSGSNWRLHPTWVYCRAKIQDRVLEMSFYNYTTQFEQAQLEKGNSATVPKQCNEFLMKHVLLDAKATCDFETKWIGAREPLKTDERGVLVVFVTTHAGLTKYVDMKLTDVEYLPKPVEVPTPPPPTTPPPTKPPGDNSSDTTTTAPLSKPIMGQPMEPPAPLLSYVHFIDRHFTGPDETFYQRALRLPGRFLFDVDVQNRVERKNEESNVTGWTNIWDEPESQSVVLLAAKAVHVGRAEAGVVGFEMVYHNFSEMVQNVIDSHCPDGDKNLHCWIIDENGFVQYTTMNDSISRPETIGRFFGEFEPCVFKRMIEGTNETGGPNNSSRLFEEVHYMDYQAICEDEKLFSDAGRFRNPFIIVWKFLLWAIRELSTLLAEYSVFSLFANAVLPTEAYSMSFRFNEPGLACDRVSKNFIANYNATTFGKTLLAQKYDCVGLYCEKTFVVNQINGSNLLFIVVRTKPECLKARLKCVPSTKCQFFFFPVGMTVRDASDKLYAADLNFKKPGLGPASGSSKKGAKKPKASTATRDKCRAGVSYRYRRRKEACLAPHPNDTSPICDGVVKWQLSWLVVSLSAAVSCYFGVLRTLLFGVVYPY